MFADGECYMTEEPYDFGEMFRTGEVPEVPLLAAVAIALNAWSGVLSRNKPPENFGVMMAALIIKYDLPALPDELVVQSKKLRGATA